MSIEYLTLWGHLTGYYEENCILSLQNLQLLFKKEPKGAQKETFWLLRLELGLDLGIV